jgi:hypothetical protein
VLLRPVETAGVEQTSHSMCVPMSAVEVSAGVIFAPR